MNPKTQDLVVLTSPPATGKTYWIRAMSEAVGAKQLLVISPLRALADECKDAWENKIKVMTPEEWLGKKTFAEIIIIDEFHLFFYWGDSFRPLMWEVFFELSQTSSLAILLTATLSDYMKKEIQNFSSQFNQILWIDRGNQKLKHQPQRYVVFKKSREIERYILGEKITAETRLIFCKYRQEVFKWQKILTKFGFTTVTCVGGESMHMKEKLKAIPRPDFIICTLVLSHGVNLPSLSKIFFLYPVNNIDFWIQMVARGGRKGESFEVYALEKPHGIAWSFWTNLLRIQILRIKSGVNWHSITRDLQIFLN